jgi:hypothetical protein
VRTTLTLGTSLRSLVSLHLLGPCSGLRAAAAAESIELLLEGVLLLFYAVLALSQSELHAAEPLGLAAFWHLLLLRLSAVRVLLDRGVHILVHLLDLVVCDAELDVLRELLLVLVLVALDELHVRCHVCAIDARAVRLRIQGLFVGLVAWEPLCAVRDLETAVDCSLQSSEHVGAGCGARETNIQKAFECFVLALLLNLFLVARNILHSRIGRVKPELLQNPPSKKQACAVSGGVVCKTNFEAEMRKFVGVGYFDATISVNTSVNHLAEDILVGESNNKSVLGSIVLIFRLKYEVLSCLVISFSLSASTVFDLETLKVLLVLDKLGEPLEK